MDCPPATPLKRALAVAATLTCSSVGGPKGSLAGKPLGAFRCLTSIARGAALMSSLTGQCGRKGPSATTFTEKTAGLRSLLTMK